MLKSRLLNAAEHLADVVDIVTFVNQRFSAVTLSESTSIKQRQRIVIADNVEMTVLAVRGNRVKIGFTAPHDVTMIRAELPLPA